MNIHNADARRRELRDRASEFRRNRRTTPRIAASMTGELSGPDQRPGRGRRIRAALGKLFAPAPRSGARGPATPGGEGRLIR